MSDRTEKSSTDLHWNERAASEKSDALVNIADTVQRELETQFLLPRLSETNRILEVGCGNGYLTEVLRKYVSFVDAFDFSENMIRRAKIVVGERNNRFFHDNVLRPIETQPPYDAIVCVRVLINLKDVQEQKTAIHNLARLLRPDGKLLLVEGYLDGFQRLGTLRSKVGLPPIQPAAINCYSNLSEIIPVIQSLFVERSTFHSGFFDMLTRVVYPLLVGADQALGPGQFHERILPLVKEVNADDFAPYARLRGMELVLR
jgi:SAM-dependent methyltransferase